MIGIRSISSPIHDLGQTLVNAQQPASEFSVWYQIRLCDTRTRKEQFSEKYICLMTRWEGSGNSVASAVNSRQEVFPHSGSRA